MLVEVKPAKMDEEDGLKEEKWVPMTLREHPRVNSLSWVRRERYCKDVLGMSTRRKEGTRLIRRRED